MSALVPIHGAGSSGAKKSRAPVEAPNNLQGKQTYRTIHLISEGTVYGWNTQEEFEKSVYFDGTPLRAEDGTLNFKGVIVDGRDGSPGQPPFTGIPAQPESISSVGAQIKKADGSLTRTFDVTNASRVKLLFSCPGLVEYKDNGDIVGQAVEFQVDVRRTGSSGGWRRLANCRISGKTTSTYPLIITAPNANSGNVDFRITRVTDDAPIGGKIYNTLVWDSFGTIIDRQLEYPGSAMVAVNFDASLFTSGLPTITFKKKHLLCQVPLNYDPVARTYANSGPGTTGGYWNGSSFKTAYTNNPAWILYNLVTNPNWGLGRYLPAGVMDQWSVYDIARYCDEMVSDGYGGQEPRYTFNGTINTREEGLRVLQAVASTFRGMVYWSAGKIVVVADMPKDPVKIFGPANVVDGRFEEEHSSLRARHSLVRVRWRDPQVNYAQAVDIVENRELLIAAGPRETDYEAIGCTSRGLARRFGRWVTYTEQYEDKTLRFKTTIEHCDAGPGDIILVNNPKQAGLRRFGRASAISQYSVTVDAAVTLSAGQTYSLRVELPDGTISDVVPVTNGAGTHTTLTLGAPGLPTGGNAPFPGTTWMLLGSDLAPTQWRVISVSEEQDGTFAFTCLRHFPGKYGLVENGLALDDTPYTVWPSSTRPLPAPTGLDVVESVGGIGATASLQVLFSWQPPDDPRIQGYEAQAVSPGQVVDATSTAGSSVLFTGLTPGPLTFQVRSVAAGGMTSAWAATSLINVDGLADPPAPPTNLNARGGIRIISVSWNRPTSGDRHIRAFEVWKSNSATFSAGGTYGEVNGTSIIVSDLVASTTHWFWVRSKDTFGQASNWVGPISATTSILITADIDDAMITTAKFAQGLSPVKIIANNLSSTDTGGHGVSEGDVAVSTADGKLYRRTSGAWVAVVRAVDMVGVLTDAQLQDLDASKLLGTIPDSKFAAQSITTSKLKVVPASLLIDPTMADDGFWYQSATEGGNPWYRESNSGFTNAYGIGHGARILSSGAYTGSGYGALFSNATIPVAAYERFTVRLRGVNAGNKPVYGGIMFTDASGAYLGEISAQFEVGAGGGGAVLREAQGSAPAGTTQGRFFIAAAGWIGVPWSGAAALTDLIVVRPATAEMIVDGEIKAAKIATNAVTSDKIAANSISSDKIQANAIVAGKLSVDAVTAGTIAAGAVNSSELAARAVKADKLAVEELVAHTVQVRNLIIGTQKLQVGSLTSAHITELTNPLPFSTSDGVMEALYLGFNVPETGDPLLGVSYGGYVGIGGTITVGGIAYGLANYDPNTWITVGFDESQGALRFRIMVYLESQDGNNPIATDRLYYCTPGWRVARIYVQADGISTTVGYRYLQAILYKK